MPSALSIHPASPDELAAAHRNVFDIWSKGLSLEDHVQSRLNSPSARRASWFVGCVEGRVVTSLGSYPVRFCVLGEEVPGIAIGSVYTLKEFRGHGFAPQLIAWVEDYEQRLRAALSVLYSDIEPNYYARRGYVLCPSFQGWCELGQMSFAEGSAPSRLTPFSPHDYLSAVMKLYADYHGAMPFSIARNDEYWGAILQKYPDDRFYALAEADGVWSGYIRIGTKGGDWRITDFALADQSDALAERLYAELLKLAHAAGAVRVGGWLPDSAAAKKFFHLTPRPTEITMVKPLAWQGVLSAEAIAGTNRFCEIDHV